MSAIIRELLQHFLGKVFGEVEFILGWPVAFAFWCVQYAIIRWPVRRAESLVLAVVASGIFTVLVMAEWDVGTLCQIILAGCLFYVPVFLFTRSRQNRARRSKQDLF